MDRIKKKLFLQDAKLTFTLISHMVYEIGPATISPLGDEMLHYRVELLNSSATEKSMFTNMPKAI